MKGKNNGKEKQEPEKRIRELEEEIRKLEDKEKGEEVSGVTQGALRGLGKMIPGFDELVKGLEKSEAFQERLRAVDTEIEHELERATALRREMRPRKSIIPPRTTLKGSGQGARGGIIPPKATAKAHRPTPKKQAAPQLRQREVIVEVLDEGDHLKVIAEMPGFTERGIEAQVKDNLLIISAKSQGRRYHEEVKLPCPVEDRVNLTYRNGVLQIRLDKPKE